MSGSASADYRLDPREGKLRRQASDGERRPCLTFDEALKSNNRPEKTPRSCIGRACCWTISDAPADNAGSCNGGHFIKAIAQNLGFLTRFFTPLDYFVKGPNSSLSSRKAGGSF